MAAFPVAPPGAPVGKERFGRGQLPTSAQLPTVRVRTSQSVGCLTVSGALSLSVGGVCWPNWHPGPHPAAAQGLGFPMHGPLELTCWLLRMSGGPVCGHGRASGATPAPGPQDKLTLLEYGPGWVSWGGSSHPPRGAASGWGGGSPEAESAWGSGWVGPGLVGTLKAAQAVHCGTLEGPRTKLGLAPAGLGLSPTRLAGRHRQPGVNPGCLPGPSGCCYDPGSHCALWLLLLTPNGKDGVFCFDIS